MELRKNQQEFLDKCLEGKNIYLSGKAGTGKTFVVKKAIDILKEKGLNVVCCAPTGVAALNIGGQTIHSLFSICVNGVIDYDKCNFVKSEKRKIFKSIDVIVFDEVSMLRPDILDAVNWTLIKNGVGSIKDKQLIFVGDLKQLPPTIGDNEKSVLLQKYNDIYFYDSDIYNSISVVNVNLEEVVRQNDVEFIENLNIIRDGGKSNYFRKFVKEKACEKSVIIAPYSQTVEEYNLKGLNNTEGELYIYKSKIYQEFEDKKIRAEDFNFEETIRVKDGCKIMYLVNSKDYNNLINGTLGIFRIKSNKNYIEVDNVLYPLEVQEIEKKEYILENNELVLRKLGSIIQYPFKLAYAMTIHKSQGLTFDNVTVDLSRPCFLPGQMYTALSRVKSPDGLTIIVNR